MRRSGRTTRLIDAYIQEYFTSGYCVVTDHHPSEAAHDNVFKRLTNRLRIEHGETPVKKRVGAGIYIIGEDESKLQNGVDIWHGLNK